MIDLDSRRDGDLHSPPPSECILDAAIECTFPASDPIAVHGAFAAACAREIEIAAVDKVSRNRPRGRVSVRARARSA